MALFINIDTATDVASVCLSDDVEVLKLSVNPDQKDHAAWLHEAIKSVLDSTGRSFDKINAVGISIGPGSYTGLRVGLSAAKGLCYALGIPLITVGTLEIIAMASNKEGADLFCPLIDARRMEVFTAVYDRSLVEVRKPYTMIIDENSFADLLASNRVCFCGNGQKKLQKLIDHRHAIFSNAVANASQMPYFTQRQFMKGEFANLAYTEPLYVKEFYSPRH